MQEASKQVTAVTTQAEEEAEKLRASYKQQVGTLEAQVADLQQAAAASSAHPGTSAPSQPQQQAATDGVALQQAGTALQQRVQQLEAANAALERALLDSHTQQPRSRSAERQSAESDADLRHTQDTLARREHQVSQLQAELKALQVCLGFDQ